MDCLVSIEQHDLEQCDIPDSVESRTASGIPTPSMYSQQQDGGDASGKYVHGLHGSRRAVSLQHEERQLGQELAKMLRSPEGRFKSDPSSRTENHVHFSLGKLLARLDHQLAAGSPDAGLSEQSDSKPVKAEPSSLCAELGDGTLSRVGSLVHDLLKPALCIPEADMPKATDLEICESRTNSRICFCFTGADLCLSTFDNPLFDSGLPGPLCRPVVMNIAAENETEALWSSRRLRSILRQSKVQDKSEVLAKDTAAVISETELLARGASEAIVLQAKRSSAANSAQLLHDVPQQAQLCAKSRGVDDESGGAQAISYVFSTLKSPSSSAVGSGSAAGSALTKVPDRTQQGQLRARTQKATVRAGDASANSPVVTVIESPSSYVLGSSNVTEATEASSHVVAHVDSARSRLDRTGDAARAIRSSSNVVDPADDLSRTCCLRRHPRAGMSTPTDTMCLSDARNGFKDAQTRTLLHSDILPNFSMDFLLPLEHRDVVDILSSKSSLEQVSAQVLDLKMMPKLRDRSQWSSGRDSGTECAAAPPAWTQLAK
jgi:hypothetical protein